jgi:T-complex protein 1 subunit alpha
MSANIFAKDPRSALMLGGGERISGQEVRDQNVTAATAIANVVRTSLGPGEESHRAKNRLCD